jgi:hypothetical protein
MTSRERWTVYPLLFLAIGLGLRSRVMGLTEVPQVVCQTLTIAGPDGKPAIRMGTIPSGAGQIDFFSPDGKLLLAAGASPDGKGGQLLLQNSQGQPQVELASTGGTGALRVCGPDGKPTAVIQTSSRGGMFVAITADRKLQLITGHDNLDSGVLIDTANGQRLAVPFGPVIRKPAPPEEKPAAPAAPEATATEEAAPDDKANPEPVAPAEEE